jgi:hypothetical protein
MRWDGLTIEDRFWSKVEKGEGCWEWTTATSAHGYGVFFLGRKLGKATGKKQTPASRVSFYFANGYWPDVCMHTCDNPPCVNPAHLKSGTTADNIADCLTKGRNAYGSRASQAKLRESEVKAIRNLIRLGISQREIARMFTVSRACIQLIGSGRNWRNMVTVCPA